MKLWTRNIVETFLSFSSSEHKICDFYVDSRFLTYDKFADTRKSYERKSNANDKKRIF